MKTDTFNVDVDTFMNFDEGFANAVDPETAQALAQGGTQLIGGIVRNRQEKNANKSDLDKTIESSCGKPPLAKRILGRNTKAYDKYLACSQKVTDDQSKLQAQALENQRLATANTPPSEDEGMSLGAKIGIGVGALAVVGAIIYFVTKK